MFGAVDTRGKTNNLLNEQQSLSISATSKTNYSKATDVTHHIIKCVMKFFVLKICGFLLLKHYIFLSALRFKMHFQTNKAASGKICLTVMPEVTSEHCLSEEYR